MVEKVHIEAAMQDWRKTVIGAQPMANADYVRTVCEEIIRRAQIISRENPVRFEDVAAFLLMRSRSWVLGGLDISKIGGRLPRTLRELGMLKLAEGKDGQPLDDADLANIKRPSYRIIQ